MTSASEPSPTPIITIPDDILRAIGKVNVVWGILESTVDLSLQKVAGFSLGDQRAHIITAHMTWPLKMDIFESIANALAPQYPHLAKFSPDIKPLLKKAQEGRNRVAHGVWGKDGDIVYKGRVSARGKLKTSLDEVTVADLEAICLDIHKATVAVILHVLNK